MLQKFEEKKLAAPPQKYSARKWAGHMLIIFSHARRHWITPPRDAS